MWRVKFTLAKIRKAARELLTLDEKDQKRLFEGEISRRYEILVNASSSRHYNAYWSLNDQE